MNRGTIPWNDQPATTSQSVNFSGQLPPWKGQCLFLVGMDVYSGYRLVFPAHNVSAETAICGYRMPHPWSWDSTHTVLIKELTSQQVK